MNNSRLITACLFAGTIAMGAPAANADVKNAAKPPVDAKAAIAALLARATAITPVTSPALTKTVPSARIPAKPAVAATPYVAVPVSALPAAAPAPTTGAGAGKTLIPGRGAWVVKRDWTRAELARYAQWIGQIHEKKSGGTTRQRRAKLSDILTDREMNLLLTEGFADDSNDPTKIDEKTLNTMDAANACGTFPILMHIYYCAVRGLPCSFTRVNGNSGDIRYSRGNHPVARFGPFDCSDLNSYVRTVSFGELNYTTGNWRTAPELEGTDTIPIAVSSQSVVPGLSLLYNSDGHGLLVSRVTTTGAVKLLDGHPDGSITSGQTLASVESVMRSVPEKGRDRWYAGMRMIRLARCVTNAEGRVVDVRPSSNQEMRAYGYSDEQYTDVIFIRKGLPVTINGHPVRVDSYPEYVRLKLQTVGEQNPVTLIQDWAGQLHTLFSERATFVSQAWQDVADHGAIPLPDNANIYQADGRWENWSSPSSDCDRKGAYFLVADQLEAMVRDFEPGRSNLVLSGFGRIPTSKKELAELILAEKRKAFDAKTVSYVSSRGKTVTLTLSDIERRLFLISFDPNHAPEVRWGASFDSPEAAGAKQIRTPLASGDDLSAPEAYRREQRLRYRLCRKEGRTSFDDSDNPTGPKPLLAERLARWAPAPATLTALPLVQVAQVRTRFGGTRLTGAVANGGR